MLYIDELTIEYKRVREYGTGNNTGKTDADVCGGAYGDGIGKIRRPLLNAKRVT